MTDSENGAASVVDLNELHPPQTREDIVREAGDPSRLGLDSPWPPEGEPLRLNVGGGGDSEGRAGWINVDRSDSEHPMEAYPLPYPEGVAAEVYASHVLEHFPLGKVALAVKDWYRVLEPGGRIRIAVPDISKIAKRIAAGLPCLAPDGREVSWAQVISGGQSDLNDFHLSCMDEADLMTILSSLGAVAVQTFEPEYPDCSQYAISANVEAYKPSQAMQDAAIDDRVAGCRTVPRLGWTRTAERMAHTAAKAGVTFISTGGAYADLGFDRALEQACAMGRDYVLITDYDTVWRPETIQRLVLLADLHPEADVIMPFQLRRGTQEILASDKGNDHTLSTMAAELVRVKTGHLGCTLFRREALESLERPWFRHLDGVDEDGQRTTVEADMQFWRKWGEAGLSLYLAAHVAVGHTEEFIVWPDQNLQPLFQSDIDFDEHGPTSGIRQ